MSEDKPQSAEGTSRVADVVELVKKLCVALTNVEMFTVEHPVSRKGIDEAFDWLQSVIRKYGKPVVISVSGKSIVLDGLPLEERNPLVQKMAKKLDDVHLSNVFFETTVTRDEFVAFYRIIGGGPKAVDAGGGVAAMFQSAGIRNITSRDVSYVMVTGDEKVVSKDAHVVEGDVIAGVPADAEVVKYMVARVLEKANEQKWLINEIKNNPQKMATLITDGIDLATSRAEAGIDKEDGAIGALLSNIRLVGESLVTETDAAPGGEAESGEDLQKALLTLEQEVRLRSNRLMSSKVASGFVNEILQVVTTYADRVRAKKIADEFLKGEAGLKKAEKLLQDLAPKGEDKELTLVRMREQLVEKGLNEEDYAKVLEGIRRKKTAAERKPSKPRKRYTQGTAEGISKKLKDLNIPESEMPQITEKLGSYIETRVREKAGELQAENAYLNMEVDHLGHALADVPWGVVLWDAEGQVELANDAAKDILGAEADLQLRDGLRAALAKHVFPLEDVPDMSVETELSEADVHLLTSVLKVVKDGQGGVVGVILLGPRRDGAAPPS